MSLNLDNEPSSGSPILSGPAANIQGDVPDVHPCNCNKSIASPHQLSPPRTAERSLGEAHAIRPSLKSLHGRQLLPTPILTDARTSLEQTRLSQSPCLNTGESQQKQRSKAPAPVTYADILQSPFTPTPASVQRRSQSPSSSSAFFTPETCLDKTITPPAPSTPKRNAASEAGHSSNSIFL
ncbi:hypothetical protein F5148DRAFT_1285606 [Russula earlei]|uniref:Uncharacterized protein n=1 Tax=Russula earlei TaxID=71964 RepID=A0ACC0U5Z3_9AGAM|nr:hypothetical protein F5148DRAFT_1285606 [Russula earlei]